MIMIIIMIMMVTIIMIMKIINNGSNDNDYNRVVLRSCRVNMIKVSALLGG